MSTYLAGVLYRASRAAAFSPLTPRTCMSCLANTSRTDWACSGGSAISGLRRAGAWEEEGLGRGSTLFFMAPALKSLKVRSKQRGFGEGPAFDSGSPEVPQGRLRRA